MTRQWKCSILGYLPIKLGRLTTITHVKSLRSTNVGIKDNKKNDPRKIEDLNVICYNTDTISCAQKNSRLRKLSRENTCGSFPLVRITGVEPAPSCPDWHLKPARLPIPPYPHNILPLRSTKLLYHIIIWLSRDF